MSTIFYLALLTWILLVLDSNVQLANGQYVLDFLKCGMLHTLVFVKASTLLPRLLAVYVGWIDANPSERHGMIWVLFYWLNYWLNFWERCVNITKLISKYIPFSFGVPFIRCPLGHTCASHSCHGYRLIGNTVDIGQDFLSKSVSLAKSVKEISKLYFV